MTYITRIANKIILAKYFLHSLPIKYLHWKLSTVGRFSPAMPQIIRKYNSLIPALQQRIIILCCAYTVLLIEILSIKRHCSVGMKLFYFLIILSL